MAARAAGTLREIQAYEVSAKSMMRLKVAMLIAQFYNNIGHILDPDNMLWPVITRFLEQWKALMEKKKANHGQPPKLTKIQAVHKWVDSFVLHLSQKVGVRNAPLDYIVRAIAAIDPNLPALQVGDLHSIETGSIDGDLTARMPHNHPLFTVDNGLTFDMIKMSVHGHDVAATIAPFLLNVSSTTEPIRRCIGSVVELTFNKSVIPRVPHWPGYVSLILALSVPDTTLPSFALLAMLNFLSAGKYYVILFPKRERNSCWELNPVPLVC
jgi:hypothetical protein